MVTRNPRWSARRYKATRSIDSYRSESDDFPSLREFLGGLGLMAGLALLLWLLSFAPSALQAVQ